jgi:NAD(P)-dependent dehydrogenase (short-subunit alcohol dehydrogenase family)
MTQAQATTANDGDFDTDICIVGSGFGGSVSALRLAEKGWRVSVLEQGRQLSDADIEAAGTDAKKLAWAPALGLTGFFAQDVFRHVAIVRGIGVGGGSNVYAAVLLEPKENFYRDPAWRDLSPDWQAELAPHYATAKHMLGVTPNPYHGIQDDWLRGAAERLGEKARATFDTVPQGIFFGDPANATPDPFFNGTGPARTGCNQCGRCITGCAYGAKNTLERNYLFFARQRGVQVMPERQVTHIEPLASGNGYRVHLKHPWDSSVHYPPLRARRVILSAGALGTQEILFASRDRYRTLPQLPAALGEHARTNSEAIVAILAKDESVDVTKGATISTHFYPDEKTHITQNRFPESYSFMKWYMGPLVDGANPAGPVHAAAASAGEHALVPRKKLVQADLRAHGDAARRQRDRVFLRAHAVPGLPPRAHLAHRQGRTRAVLVAAGERRRARLRRGRRRHAAEQPRRKHRQPERDRAHSRRRGDGLEPARRRHRPEPRSVRSSRPLRCRWRGHPGECRGESVAHHHRAGGTLRCALPFPRTTARKLNGVCNMQRKILVTGGSSGLGLALAGALAARGDSVGLLARDERKLAAAADGIRRQTPGARVYTAAADVQDEAALALVLAQLAQQMGGLDVLVNSAGILREGHFETTTPDTHREVMAINYFGTLNAIRAALPLLRQSRVPRIVNIASIAGLTGVFGYTAYCASKHALVGLTESLRYEMEPQGITVQLVCPGEFDSPMVDAMDVNRTPENRAHAQTIPKVGVDVVLRDTLKALDSNAYFIVPGAYARLSAFSMRHFPGISRAVGRLRIRRVYTGPTRRA